MAKKITVSQIKTIRNDYAARLGEQWQRLGNDALIRHNGIIGQRIWFDRLRTGEYRPTVSIQAFVAPSSVGGTGTLVDFLPPLGRQLTVKSHEELIENVIDKLRTSTSLAINAPLQTKEIAVLIESLAAPNLAECYCLGCLSAFLGENCAFKEWFDRFDMVAKRIEQNDPERRSFLEKVAGWIKMGGASKALEAVAREEIGKAGIAQ